MQHGCTYQGILLDDLVWITSLPLLDRTGRDNFVFESHARTARGGHEEMVQRWSFVSSQRGMGC